MEEFVARRNIEHLRSQLARQTDEQLRQTILRLLAAEEAKLAALRSSEQERR